jgi:hypothetical protein
MAELIKAMRRNWRQSSSLRQQLLFENALPEKEHVSLCKTRFVLRYN